MPVLLPVLSLVASVASGVMGGIQGEKAEDKQNEASAASLLEQKRYNDAQLGLQERQFAASQAQNQGQLGGNTSVMNTAPSTEKTTDTSIPGASQLLGGGNQQANQYTWA